MQDTIEHVTTATDKITSKINKFSNDLQVTMDQLAQVTQELVEKTTESANKTVTETTAQPPLTHQSLTYAAVTQWMQHGEWVGGWFS